MVTIRLTRVGAKKEMILGKPSGGFGERGLPRQSPKRILLSWRTKSERSAHWHPDTALARECPR